MDEPTPGIRAKPGEYFLAAESVHVGMRFQVPDAVYEVVGEPKKWGAASTATVEQIEGRRPSIRFNAMLHTGRKVDG